MTPDVLVPVGLVILGAALIVAPFLWLHCVKKVEAERHNNNLEIEGAREKLEVKIIAANAAVQREMAERYEKFFTWLRKQDRESFAALLTTLNQAQQGFQDGMEALLSALFPIPSTAKRRRVGENEVPAPTEIIPVIKDGKKDAAERPEGFVTVSELAERLGDSAARAAVANALAKAQGASVAWPTDEDPEAREESGSADPATDPS